jgi:hypothetical protein
MIFQDYGTSRAHVFLGARAFTDAVAGLKAKGASIGPCTRAEEEEG